MHKYEDDEYNFINSLQTITSISTVVLFLIYLPLHTFIDNFTKIPLPLMIFMFVDLFFTPSYQFWMARQRYKYKYKSVVFVTVALCLTTLIANIVSVMVFENKLYAKIISTVVVNCSFCVFFYFYFCIKGKISQNKEIRKYIKYALKFNLPLIPHFLAAYVLNLSDRLMIGYLAGEREAGLYSVAYSISSIMIFVNTAINQVVPPWFYKRMDDKDYGSINRICRIVLLFIAVINLLLILIAPELIKIFSTNEYLEAIWVVPPIASSGFFIFLIDFIANAEYYFDETRKTKWISIIPAILNIILNYFLIIHFGYIAAGYTTLISYITFAVIRYIYMKSIVKRHGLHKGFIGWKPILIIAIVFLLLSSVSLITYNYVVVRYSVFGFLFLLTLTVVILKKEKIKNYFKTREINPNEESV